MVDGDDLAVDDDRGGVEDLVDVAVIVFVEVDDADDGCDTDATFS